MNPGIYSDLPFDEYLKVDATSNSYLSRLAITPAHMLVPVTETPAMAFGTAFHTYVLEQNKFGQTYAVTPSVDRRTKAGKATYDEFTAKNAGKTIICADDLEAIQHMDEAIRKHPEARLLFKEGIAEQSVFWKDTATGLMCKARPDWLTGDTIVDLKKTRDASERGFQRSIVQYRYYQQVAMYLAGMDIVSDTEYDQFVFIAVCDQPPYEVGVYTLSQEFIEYGYYEFRRLLEKFKLHKELNLFPNYVSAGIVEINKPAWLR